MPVNNTPDDPAPVTAFAEAAAADGWRFVPAHDTLTGFRAIPLEAMRIGGVPHATLIRGDVSVAFDRTVLYYHDGRVWTGDPCFDVRHDRVTIAGIVVRPAARRQGEATRALESLCRVADAAGFTLILEATPMREYRAKGERLITGSRLAKWYGRFGFEFAYPQERGPILSRRPVVAA